MVLHSEDNHILKAFSASETLPDPAAFPRRTHELVNAGAANATWTAPGATPFLVDGVAAASVTVPPGGSAQVQSNGAQWVLIRPAGTRRTFAASGVTDGSGNVTFTFTPPFSAPPVVVGQPGPSSDTALVELKLTALSASSATFNMRRAPAVTILGISVITFPVNAPGVTVQCLATSAGQGV